MAKKFQRRSLADVTGDSVALASDGESSGAMITAADLKYDYSGLPEAQAAQIQGHAIGIKRNERQAAQGIIKIGNHLIAVKDELPHGEFGNWLETEFSWKKSTAANFMNVARKFPTVGNLGNFGLSALYALSAPSVDDGVVEEAVKLAESGKKITRSAVRELVNKSNAVYVEPGDPDDSPAPSPRERVKVAPDVVPPRYVEPFSPAIMAQVEDAPIANQAADTGHTPGGTLLVELPVDVINELVGIIDQNGLGFLMRKPSVDVLRAALVEVLE